MTRRNSIIMVACCSLYLRHRVLILCMFVPSFVHPSLLRSLLPPSIRILDHMIAFKELRKIIGFMASHTFFFRLLTIMTILLLTVDGQT